MAEFVECLDDTSEPSTKVQVYEIIDNLSVKLSGELTWIIKRRWESCP